MKWSGFLPGDIRVFPLHIKISVPMSNSMVVCRYLQSWLTVAMKCRVMYSYSRQPSLPAGPAEDKELGSNHIVKTFFFIHSASLKSEHWQCQGLYWKGQLSLLYCIVLKSSKLHKSFRSWWHRHGNNCATDIGGNITLKKSRRGDKYFLCKITDKSWDEWLTQLPLWGRVHRSDGRMVTSISSFPWPVQSSWKQGLYLIQEAHASVGGHTDTTSEYR